MSNLCYVMNQTNYNKIPGSPVAYWASEKFINLFGFNSISFYGHPCKGIDTGDNARFLRVWYEINSCKMSSPRNRSLSNDELNKKWFPYNKGGNYRKWYGNNEYLVNYENHGKEIKAFEKSNLRNKQFYFQNGLTWTTVSSGTASYRLFGYGFLFDNGGSCLFSEKYLLYLLGLLNSKVVNYINSLSPTLNFQPGDVGRIPCLYDDLKEDSIIKCVDCAVYLSKTDWDSFETSWDFKRHPLI